MKFVELITETFDNGVMNVISTTTCIGQEKPKNHRKDMGNKYLCYYYLSSMEEAKRFAKYLKE